MRHKKSGRKLQKSVGPRVALLRAITSSLFKFEKIETTEARAKEVRKFAEKLITIAKKGDLHSRRVVLSYLPFPSVVKKLFEQIAPLYKEKNGGYTQILKVRRRPGDGAKLVILMLAKE